MNQQDSFSNRLLLTNLAPKLGKIFFVVCILSKELL